MTNSNSRRGRSYGARQREFASWKKKNERRNKGKYMSREQRQLKEWKEGKR